MEGARDREREGESFNTIIFHPILYLVELLVLRLGQRTSQCQQSPYGAFPPMVTGRFSMQRSGTGRVATAKSGRGLSSERVQTSPS